MNTSRLLVGTILCLCVLLSDLHYAWGKELRCQCINYYSGIPWTATCVYLKPKSAACNQYELIVYNGSERKTCVRVRNTSAFERFNRVTWFKVTKGKGKNISLKLHNGSCAVVS
uniref:Chemokine vCXCL5 n=1 Tax=Simian cytomegalovirus (strain Colburn) TaxID=50292 RepID=D2E309_SCMVC|nr:chemokine vCXCL5 [Cercopithecine betaherpesvirus 5]